MARIGETLSTSGRPLSVERSHAAMSNPPGTEIIERHFTRIRELTI
jgi:hypothetical protein